MLEFLASGKDRDSCLIFVTCRELSDICVIGDFATIDKRQYCSMFRIGLLLTVDISYDVEFSRPDNRVNSIDYLRRLPCYVKDKHSSYIAIGNRYNVTMK